MGFSYSPGMLPWKPMTSFAELTTARTPSLQETPEKSFGNYLWDGVSEVNNMQHDANDAIHELLTGGDVNSAEVMTTVQKSEMAFRLLTQIRNKMLTAYEELNAIRF